MIVGITGTNGSGKGEVVRYLLKCGFVAHSVREHLERILAREGIVCDRSELREKANVLRRTYGSDYLIRTLIEEAGTKNEVNSVVESVRTIGEVEYLKQKGGVLLAVDADRSERYKRIKGRASSTDHIDFDTFVSEEEREWHGTLGEHDMNLLGVMKMADFTIMNNGTKEALYKEIDRVLEAARGQT